MRIALISLLMVFMIAVTLYPEETNSSSSAIDNYLRIFGNFYFILQDELITDSPLSSKLIFTGAWKGLSNYARSNSINLKDISGNFLENEFTSNYTLFKKVFLDLVLTNRLDLRSATLSSISGMIDNLENPQVEFFIVPSTDSNRTQEKDSADIGLQLDYINGKITVTSPIKFSPAYRAGVMPGDILIQLDDKPVQGLRLYQLNDYLRNVAGTSVRLKLIREGISGPFTISIIRENLKINSIEVKNIDYDKKNYLWIQVQFLSKYTLQKLLALFKTVDWKIINGILLDIRNCPLGSDYYVAECINLFIDNGPLFNSSGRTDKNSHNLNAIEGQMIVPPSTPIVTLINKGSVKCSELFAAVMHNRDRCKLI